MHRLPSRSLRRRLVLWAVLLFASAGLARAAIGTLVTPAAPVRPGATISVELLLVNEGATTTGYALRPLAGGRLAGPAGRWDVTLRADRGDVAVPPGGFVRWPLQFLVPADATGRLVLELDHPLRVRGVIDVAADAPAAPVAEAAPPALPAALRLKRYYADHFSAHEPMYFLFGPDKPAAKFQLSLKYRLLNEAGPLARRWPALRGLYLGYTQRSLWDITSSSSPFYDTSYMPEILFETLAPDAAGSGGFTWLGLQAGLQHESNGRDGDGSRSLNTFYLRPMFAFGDLEGWRLILRPKFFFYVSSLDENEDLERFRGYSELRAIFGKNNRLSVSVTGRIGADFDRGAVQVDVSYPTEFLTGNLAVYLHAQYWNGYGESLLSYDRQSETVRFGFSLAR